VRRLSTARPGQAYRRAVAVVGNEPEWAWLVRQLARVTGEARPGPDPR
jgi:hypothetical protein